MKIKRYTAASMRAALALVRAEQGPDAVILSSRRGDDGIEVIAAVDYDEALFVDAKRQSTAPAIAPPSRDTSPASVTIAQAAPAAAVAPAAPSRRPSRPSRVPQRPRGRAARRVRTGARRTGARRHRARHPPRIQATAPCSANCRTCAACSRPGWQA